MSDSAPKNQSLRSRCATWLPKLWDWAPIIAVAGCGGAWHGILWLAALVHLDRNRRQQPIEEKKLDLQAQALDIVHKAANQGMSAQLTTETFDLRLGPGDSHHQPSSKGSKEPRAA